jgi:hypothetical protein
VAQLRLIFAVDRTDKLLSGPAKYLPGSGFSEKLILPSANQKFFRMSRDLKKKLKFFFDFTAAAAGHVICLTLKKSKFFYCATRLQIKDEDLLTLIRPVN